MRRQKPQNSEPRVGLTPGGLEKPRREEAITTSNGRGLDEQKKWGSKWPAQRYRVVLSCRSTNTDDTDAALSPMMISEVPYCTLGTPRTNLGTNVISNAKPRCLWCPQPSAINPGTLPFRPPTSGSCLVHHAQKANSANWPTHHTFVHLSSNVRCGKSLSIPRHDTGWTCDPCRP
jgi:hypothetical protein